MRKFRHGIGRRSGRKTFGPLYGDAFSNELETFHRHITEGTKPVTDLAGSRRDLALMAEIIERMKESRRR